MLFTDHHYVTDTYKEQLLRRELNLLDFNKLSPEALNELVTQSIDESKKMKQIAGKYQESAKKVQELLESKNRSIFQYAFRHC